MVYGKIPTLMVCYSKFCLSTFACKQARLDGLMNLLSTMQAIFYISCMITRGICFPEGSVPSATEHFVRTTPLSSVVMEPPMMHKPSAVPINTSEKEVELQDRNVKDRQNLLHPFSHLPFELTAACSQQIKSIYLYSDVINCCPCRLS